MRINNVASVLHAVKYVGAAIMRWRTKWWPCKGMAVSQAFIFHFKWYSLLHFAVCQLPCWAFLFCLTISLILTSYIYSVTLPELPPEDDCRRAFMAAIGRPMPDRNNKNNALKQPGPERGEQSSTTGYRPPLRFETGKR